MVLTGIDFRSPEIEICPLSLVAQRDFHRRLLFGVLCKIWLKLLHLSRSSKIIDVLMLKAPRAIDFSNVWFICE